VRGDTGTVVREATTPLPVHCLLPRSRVGSQARQKFRLAWLPTRSGLFPHYGRARRPSSQTQRASVVCPRSGRRTWRAHLYVASRR